MLKFRTIVPVLALVALGGGVLMAQRGGMPAGPQIDSHDISGWTLSFNGRASRRHHCCRACESQARRICASRLAGDSVLQPARHPVSDGHRTARDIRVGHNAIVIAPENSPAPRYIYTARTHTSARRSTTRRPTAIRSRTGKATRWSWTPSDSTTRAASSAFPAADSRPRSASVERYALLKQRAVLSVEFTVTDPTGTARLTR